MRPEWWRWAVPVAAIALSLAVAELVLRVLDRDPITIYRHDDLRGWSLRPGYAGWHEGENRVWVQINTDGLRDREHRVDAAPATIRIAVLGDSYMEALNLPFERSFAALLEARVDRCAQHVAKRAEVINFGVGGYGTTQELLTYRNQVRKYRPDIVLLAVYTSNDILDNSQALDYRPGGSRPFFSLRDGVLGDPDWPPVEDPPVHLPLYQQWRLALTERSLAATLVWNGWSAFRAAVVGPAAPVIDAVPADRPTDEELKRAMLQPPESETLEDAWHVTEALFAEMARDVEEDGAQFWMTTLSTAEQVDPDPAVRGALARELGVESLFYADDRIAGFAHARGIPLVSLARPLADYAVRHRIHLNGGFNAEFPVGRGHWNDTGHRVAAEIVGDRLCKEARALSSR
jgi:hypothetical protein